MKKNTSHPLSVSEKGQAIIVIVFSLVGLIALAALAIDGGRAYIERGQVQSAADAAALAGALARIEQKNWREYALGSALANGYDNNGETNIIELNTPPVSGENVNNPEYIQVIITSQIPTFFGGVIGISQITVSSQAVSQTKPAEFGQMFDGYALVSLAPTSKCEEDKHQRSFWIHGEATISLTGGGVFVNSNNPDCAFIQQGSGSVRIIDDSPISIVGGAQIQKPQLLTPFPPQIGSSPINYPPPFKMPQVGCGTKVAEISGGVPGPDGKIINATLSPGSWGEDFPPEGVTFLESGVYCIGGNVSVEGTLIGTGVVLLVEKGSVGFAKGAEVQLSAPKSGQLAGLLLYMPQNNHSRITLNGNNNSNYKGTILAPGADLHLNGLDSREGYHSQIVGYYISVDGQDNIQIVYRDDQNFDAYKMPEVLLSD